MKYLNPLIILLLIFEFTGCKDKEDNPIPVKNRITETGSIIKTFYPSDQEIVAPYYNPSVILNYLIDSVFHITIDGESRMVKIKMDTLITDDKLSYTYFVNTDSIAIYNRKAFTISSTPNDIETVNIKYVFRWLIFVEYHWVNAIDNEGNPKVERGTLTYKIDKSKIGEDVIYQLVNTGEEIEPFSGFTLKSDYPTETEMPVSPYYKLKKIDIGFTLQEEGGSLITLSPTPFGKRILLSHENQLISGAEYTLKGNYYWQVYNGKEWLSDSRVKSYSFTLKTKKLINEFNPYYQYVYPCINQYHFLKNEYPQGYMKLDKIPEQMNNLSTTGKLLIQLTDIATGDSIKTEANWDSQKHFLSYDMPSDFLQNEKIYKLEVVKSEENSRLVINELTYHFRTSIFNNFLEKVNGMILNYTIACPPDDRDLTSTYYTCQEYFDHEELKTSKIDSNTVAAGLIQSRMDYSSGNYYNVRMVVLYDSICKNPDCIKWRDPGNNNLFPSHCGYFRQTYTKSLSPEDILNGAQRITPKYFSHREYFVRWIGNDYSDLWIYGVNYESIINMIGKSIGERYEYVLPGLNKETNSYSFILEEKQ